MHVCGIHQRVNRVLAAWIGYTCVPYPSASYELHNLLPQVTKCAPRRRRNSYGQVSGERESRTVGRSIAGKRNMSCGLHGAYLGGGGPARSATIADHPAPRVAVRRQRSGRRHGARNRTPCCRAVRRSEQLLHHG